MHFWRFILFTFFYRDQILRRTTNWRQNCGFYLFWITWRICSTLCCRQIMLFFIAWVNIYMRCTSHFFLIFLFRRISKFELNLTAALKEIIIRSQMFITRIYAKNIFIGLIMYFCQFLKQGSIFEFDLLLMFRSLPSM